MATTGVDLDRILKTIRTVESHGDYTIRNQTSSASGAYQFTDQTWVNVGGGKYAQRAYLATPAEQDEIARGYVQRILDEHGGDINAVPQVWYVGHVVKPEELDWTPPGNKMSVREYLVVWLANYGGVGGGGWLPGVPNPLDAGADLAGQAAELVAGAFGAAVEPFVAGLRRLSIIGIAVLAGTALVVAGAWRGVKA